MKHSMLQLHPQYGYVLAMAHVLKTDKVVDGHVTNKLVFLQMFIISLFLGFGIPHGDKQNVHLHS